MSAPSATPRERQAGAQRTMQDLANRLRAARRSGIELTLAGSKSGKDRDSGEAAGPSDRLGAGRDLPAGSSLSLTMETRTRETVSLWGRGAVTRFDGREGNISLDGEVASGMVGVDWSRDPGSRLGGRDRSGSGAGAWTAGLIVSHSVGEGGYAGKSQGRVEATLTGLWPWGRLALSEGVDVWGAAGYGFPAWGGRFASVPEIGLGLSGTGREYILGWRLKDDGSRGSGRFQLSTEARRIETAGGGGPAEHRIGARLSARW